MKTYAINAVLAVVLLTCANIAGAQTPLVSANDFSQATIKEMNAFLKKALDKDSKFKELMNFSNGTAELKLKNSLTDFSDCEIGFESVRNSSIEDSVETYRFSLGNLAPNGVGFNYNNQEITIFFSYKSKSIAYQKSSSIKLSTYGQKTHREVRGRTQSFFIRLKPNVHPSAIKAALLRSVELCRQP